MTLSLRTRAARRPSSRRTVQPAAVPPYHPAQDSAVAVRAVGLRRVYGASDTAVVALDDVDITFDRGTFTAIMGASGSGKTTLMQCLAGLDGLDAGQIWMGGTDLSALRDDALTRLRRDRIGFVFQAYNLLPVLDARANICLPFDLAGRTVDQGRFDEVVARLGLGDRLTHRPHQLSGGQQQRVAIARALLARPDVVYADEPTGNLDARSSAEVLTLLQASAADSGQTVVMVTHDPIAASYAGRVVVLTDGRVIADLDHPGLQQIAAAVQPEQV